MIPTEDQPRSFYTTNGGSKESPIEFSESSEDTMTAAEGKDSYRYSKDNVPYKPSRWSGGTWEDEEDNDPDEITSAPPPAKTFDGSKPEDNLMSLSNAPTLSKSNAPILPLEDLRGKATGQFVASSGVEVDFNVNRLHAYGYSRKCFWD
ncbi:hypothetical protein R1sor_021644 [Riccia sorocarpa]|uniref:Uncharacterized protein n=1 Tax=Riccia sorocarpa TaxID=122646 RepID=A0ABD3GHM7_9MARC